MVYVVILLLVLAVGGFLVYSRRRPVELEREAAENPGLTAAAEEDELTVSAAEQRERASSPPPLSAPEREVVRERAAPDDVG